MNVASTESIDVCTEDNDRRIQDDAEKEKDDTIADNTMVNNEHNNDVADVEMNVERDRKDSCIMGCDSKDSDVEVNDKTITETKVHAQIHFDQCLSKNLSQDHLQNIQGIV